MAIKDDLVPSGRNGIMLRQGESGRDSDAVIKICLINALKQRKINLVGKHGCTKAEPSKVSKVLAAWKRTTMFRTT